MRRLDTFNRLYSLCLGEKSTIKFILMADVFWEHLRYGTELQDYFQYEFFKLKNSERRKYMTFTKLLYTMRICNDPNKRKIFDDKALFNQIFAKYIHREWLDVTTASYEEFYKFVKQYSSFFVKARCGMFGINAGRYDVSLNDSIPEYRSLYQTLKEKGCLTEQLVKQHPEFAKFNSSSVNTLRIVTLICADGIPKVMAAVLRIGRYGKTADNFHHYGIAATIDIETGIVNAPGIDREFKRYIVHPDSGEQIIGFNIPFWNRAIEFVKQAALVVPEVRYVGWDVAIDSEGNIQLIEGNYGADPDVTQMPCRIGKWPDFSKELDMINKNR